MGKKSITKPLTYGTIFTVIATIWKNFSEKGQKIYYPNVKNTPFVLPDRRNSKQTPATCSSLLYFQKIRIYICVRINSDA
jgi:hypothetical protein